MSDQLDPLGLYANNSAASNNDPLGLLTGDSAKPVKQNKGIVGDTVTSLKRGIEQIPGIATGLADLAPAIGFGIRPVTKAAEWVGEKTGFEPGKWADKAQAEYSDNYQNEQKAIADAWQDPNKGALDIAGEYLKNPAYTVQQVANSIPSMVAGGVLSKGLMIAGRAAAPAAEMAGAAAKEVAPGYLERAVGDKWAAPVAGGTGEGAVQAGQQMEQDKDLADQRKNAVAALGSGVVDAVIGMGAGRLAEHFGLETAETAMAKAFDTKVKQSLSLGQKFGRAGAMAGGATSEGVLQELPQSAQEQMWQNYAEDKPLYDGVPRQAVEGAIAGFAMGAGANINSASHGVAKDDVPPPAPAADTAPILGLPNRPHDTMFVFSDGSTGTQSQIDSYIAAKPEGERAHAMADLMYGAHAPDADPNAGPLASAAKPLALPNRPHNIMYSFSDGSTGTQEQIDGHINSLAPEQRASALASLMYGAKIVGAVADAPHPNSLSAAANAGIASGAIAPSLSLAAALVPLSQRTQEQDHGTKKTETLTPEAQQQTTATTTSLTPSGIAAATVNSDLAGTPENTLPTTSSSTPTTTPASAKHSLSDAKQQAGINQADLGSSMQYPKNNTIKSTSNLGDNSGSQAPTSDEVASLATSIRQHVETLTRRRKVISQIAGISNKEYGVAIEKAKLAMQSGRGKAADFIKLAKRFSGKDMEIHAALTSIANLLTGPAVKKEQKPSGNLIQRIKQLGGINKDYAEDFGAKDAKFDVKSAFKQGGESPDFIAQQLKDEGYPLADGDLIGGLSEFVRRYINGERSFKHVDAETSAMSAHDDAAFQEMIPAAEQHGINWRNFKSPDDLYIEITKAEDALNDAEEAALDIVLGDDNISLDNLPQSNDTELNAWLSGEDDARGHTESTASPATGEQEESSRVGAQDTDGAQAPGFELQGQTSAEVIAQADAERAAASAEQSAIQAEARAKEKTAEDKRRAGNVASGAAAEAFSLTQTEPISKSEQNKADKAKAQSELNGQVDIFAKPAQEEKPAETTNEYAAKWFGSHAKAAEFIKAKKAGATHEVIEAGKSRFEIQLKKPAGPTLAPKVETTQFANNKIFTADKVAAARARMKQKLGTVNSGIDPELLQDGMTLAGAYIESGARSFSAYSKAMVDDLGDAIKPYLRSFYESIRHYPGLDVSGMTTGAQIDLDDKITESKKEPEQKTEELKAWKDEGLHFATGKADFNLGKPRILPSYFTAKTGKNPKDWYRGWDAASIDAKPNAITAAKKDTFIGKNADGIAIYADERGVRHYFSTGIKIQEAVGIIPGGGIEIRNRKDEYKSAEELGLNQKDNSLNTETEKSATKKSIPWKDTVPIIGERLANEGYKNITEARAHIGKLLDITIKAGDINAKISDETIEYAVVVRAREIVSEGESNGKTSQEIYAELVDLYQNKMPNLNVRTSTSVEQQAYSTPVPLAYVASKLAGITDNSVVSEPSAGNGALLIGANPERVFANELNKDRAAALEGQGVTHVSQEDGVTWKAPQQVDAVIANPPFGVVRDSNGGAISFKVNDKYSTNEIDHAISMNALKAMKDDGTAVLILGGVNSEDEAKRSDAYNGKAKRAFYFTLYGEYNVVDHFTVSGDMYAKQGAGWPVDVIVIKGRGKSAMSLPAAKVPRIVNDYNELGKVLENETTETTAANSESIGISAQPGKSGTAGVASTGAGVRGGGNGGTTANRKPGSILPGVNGSAESANPNSDRSIEPAAIKLPDSTATGGYTDTEQSAPALVRSNTKEEAETSGQVHYIPTSQADNIGTLVPVNMGAAIKAALGDLEKRVGNIDKFVAEKLGYKVAELSKFFSAEQVDALALALDNISNGGGFIIGDQTGVGKGRVVAGVIRYAIKNGKTPIFVTEKPNLYGDMIRDLTDIGMADVRPFMTNSGEEIPLDQDASDWIDAKDKARANGEKAPPRYGRFLKTPANTGKLMSEMMDAGSIGEHEAIFTTYSQMQTVKEQVTPRMNFIKQFASNSIIIFDESHNAGGTEAGDRGSKVPVVNRSTFSREIAGVAHGVFYSSATYAKRPSVMSLYFRTSMAKAVKNIKDLGEAISAGGVPLQQVVATMLAKAGQYVRRERSFAGVEYNVKQVEVDKQIAENASTIFRAINEFDILKKSAVAEIAKALKDDAKLITEDRSSGSAGVVSTNFTSVLHNNIAQLLLALKAKAAVAEGIDALKKGEKVVLTLANTMGSFIQEYAEENDLQSGDAIDLNYSDLLHRYLEKARMVTEKDAYGVSERKRLTDEDLGPQAAAAWKSAYHQINAMDFSAIPISPIDYVKNELSKAGFKTGEITGRQHTIDYSGKNPVYRLRPSSEKSIGGRMGMISKFNNGEHDAIILNQSGATGLSLHASSKFKDQRQRHMIIMQAEANIDTHMQMLGRVHRTGQVITPRYTQLAADIPAEKRPAAVLAKKMASLNANTTASAKSALTAEDSIDFMNEYGDQVAAEIMQNDPELHALLGTPLGQSDTGGLEKDGAIRKVTGRLPLLPLAKQDEIYQLLESDYKELIAQMDAMGTNKLEAKTLDADAKTTEKVEVFKGAESNNPFEQGAYAETVDMKKQGRSYSAEKVKELINTELGSTGLDIDELAQRGRVYAKEMLATFSQEFNAYSTEILDDITDYKYRNTTSLKLNAQADRVISLLRNNYVGKSLVINQDGTLFHAMITKIEHKAGAKNPAALGSWKVTFAVADALRHITLPMTKLKTGSDGNVMPGEYLMSTSATDAQNTLKLFDQAQTASREKRTIITGNLLAGYGQFKGGQIAHFTDSDGKLRQGILMPHSFDLKAALNAGAIPLTPEQVVRFIKEGNGGRIVTNASGLVRLISTSYGGDSGYRITVPSSKVEGGKYFLNRALTEAIGGDFVKVGSVMRAEISDDRQLIKALNVLAGMDEVMGTDTFRAEAKKIAGIKDVEIPAFSRGNQSSAAISEQEAIDKGFTLKVYRGISKAKPFNDTGTVWATTSKEVAQAYADEVFGYDDAAVITMMVNTDGIKKTNMRTASDEVLDSFEYNTFTSPQDVGIYQNSDDSPLGSAYPHTAVHVPIENTVIIDNGDTGNNPAFRRGGPSTSASKEAVEQIAAALVKGAARVPEIVTVQSAAELPFAAPKDAHGALWKGRIYLVADNLGTTEDVRETVAHELYGHFGLRGFFGKELDTALAYIHLHNPRVRSMATAWKLKHADMIETWTEEIDKHNAKASNKIDAKESVRFRSIEEAMAEIAETGETIKGVQRLAALVQQLLRAIGLHNLADKLEAKTDAEALTMLKKAEMFVQRGTDSSSMIPEAAYPLFMTAWHGSPHDHNNFDMSKVGTGEGNQAYGHGLYFAGARDVAEYYRDTTSQLRTDVQAVTAEILPGRHFTTKERAEIYKAAQPGERTELAGQRLQYRQSSLRDVDSGTLDKIIAKVSNTAKGNLYQVDLKPAEDEYLDWDKPLSEQSKKVQAALNIYPETWTGQKVYNYIAADRDPLKMDGLSRQRSVNDGSRFASEELHTAGIRGIKYLDGASRFGGKDASHNYVIFNDKDVEITAKFKSGKQSDEAFARMVTEEFTAENDPAFIHKVSQSKSLSDVLDEVAKAEYHGEHTLVDEKSETGADHRFIFTTDKGDQFKVFTTDDGKVWIDVSDVEQGGGGQAIYAAVANYAYNAGKVFGGDPAGLSKSAIFRRTSNMLSSALRFGTTRHLDAAKEQIDGDMDNGIEPLNWHGSDIDKVEALVHSFTTTSLRRAPELNEYSYDFQMGEFIDGKGRPVTGEAMAENIARGTGIGKATARRVVFLKSLISGGSKGVGERNGILEKVLGWGDSSSPQSLDAIFSRGSSKPVETIIGDTGRDRTPEQLTAFRNLGRSVTTPTLKERMAGIWQDAGKKLAQGVVDQFRPIRDLDSAAYTLMRLSKGAAGAFEVLLKGGQLRLNDGVYDFDEGKRGGVVKRLLTPLQGEADDFLWWVAANRAEKLSKEDREHLFTPQDIVAMKSLSDGNTKFSYTLQHGLNKGKTTSNRAEVYADSLKTFNEFHKNTLDMAEQSGLIDGEARKHWESEFYVPFYRVEEDEGGVRGMNIKSGVMRQQAFKQLKGGSGKLNSDLLDNALMNWAHLLDAAAKNRAAKASLEAAANVGVAEETGEPTKKSVWFMDKGQKRHFTVSDPLVLDALTSLEFAGMRNPLMNAMGFMKNALTIGVTASPFFKVRNLIRDSVQAIASSDLSYNPVGNVAEGWKLTKDGSDSMFRLLAGGGTIHFGTMMEGNESKRVRSLVEAGVDDSTILDNESKYQAFYRRMIEPSITAYNELGNRGEAVNRASLYAQLIRQGKSHAEASLMARDLMDFSMQGSWTSIRFLTQTVPFLNARLQGLYKLGRAAQEDPRKMGIVLGAVAVSSIALMLAYSDDDDWKKRDDWDRDSYFWFKIGGVAFRIPKPFEIGAIASVAERGIELFTSDEMTGERFGNRMYQLLSDNLSMNPIPQLVKPIMDVYANKDSFTGRPIESMGMEKLDPQYRFTQRTSMTARALSTGTFGAASPVQIDHLIKGYFGWLGTFIISSADVIAKPASGQTPGAATDWMKTATGGIISGLADAPSRYVTQMYTQSKAIEQAYGTWRSLQKTDPAEAAVYRAGHLDELRQFHVTEAVKKAESGLNMRIRLIERSDKSPEEKRELIRAINLRKDMSARRLVSVLNQ